RCEAPGEAGVPTNFALIGRHCAAIYPPIPPPDRGLRPFRGFPPMPSRGGTYGSATAQTGECDMLPDYSMRQLLEAGVHFGHQSHRWNPKMAQFIFGTRNNIH